MIMAFVRIALLAVLLIASALYGQQLPADLQQQANRIASSILMGKSMDTLRQLTDGFGGRVSGTPAYNGAVEWAARKFREAGIKNVRLEPFTIPNGWQRGPARGGITKPIQRAIHIESLGWSPSTP